MKTEAGVKFYQNLQPKNKVKTSGFEQILMLSLLGFLSAGALSSCGANPSKVYNSSAPITAGAPAPAVSEKMAPAAPADKPVAEAEITRDMPQLIKKAELNIVVQSIDKTMKEVANIVQKNRGDIMGFQDSKPQDPSIRHTATMQIRIPQQSLETTLERLAKLGTVQNRALTAEDVSQQLVDIDARLRNLRKSEEMTLKIMDRSGSVGDILKVSQQLNNIRSDIERLDAQQKSLRNQVAFSTISLTLEAAVSGSPETEPSLGIRMQESWGKATHSVSEFSLSLLALSIWIFAFSPYFLLAGAAYYGVQKMRKNKALPRGRENE